MTERSLFDAMGRLDARKIAEALGDVSDEPAPAAEPVPAKAKPDKGMSPVWRWILTAGCAAVCIVSAVMLIRLIPKNDYTYMQHSAGENEITRELNPAETTTAQQTDTTEAAVQTQTDDTHTDAPQTKPSDSAAVSLTETQTTAKQSESTHTTRETTASTAKSTKETSRQTTSQQPETTTQPEPPAKRGADPEQLIQELKTGIAPGFLWDDGSKFHAPCDVWYQTYGVAFLCDDIEALKKNGIGSAPVNWSDGAWTLYGSNGYGYLAGATEQSCLVQPMTGFLQRYGDNPEFGGALGNDLPFSFTREQEISVYRVLNDYASAGKTVYIASAGTWDQAKVTAYGGGAWHDNSGKYCDYSDMIRALADDPSVTLLGLVNCEERVRGGVTDDGIRVYFRPSTHPDISDFAWLNEFNDMRTGDITQKTIGQTSDGSEVQGFYFWLNQEKLKEMAGVEEKSSPTYLYTEEEVKRLYSAMQSIIERIEAMPDVLFAAPILGHLD